MEQVKVKELPLKMAFYERGNHGCSQEVWRGLRRCLQVLTFWLRNFDQQYINKYLAKRERKI